MSLFNTIEFRGKEIYIKGKKIGVLSKDRTLILFKKEEHYFKNYDGWGVNAELIEFLGENGYADYVEIRTEKKIYRTHILNFLFYGIIYYYRDGNGYVEKQLILPIRHWQKYDK